jgi:hypothetical protein
MVETKVDERVLKMGNNIKCSSGWLQHFKKEVNTTQQSASRGGASAEVYLAEKWQEHMTPFITQYDSKGHSQT